MKIVEGTMMTVAQALEVAEFPTIYVQEVRDRALRILGEVIRQLNSSLKNIQDSVDG